MLSALNKAKSGEPVGGVPALADAGVGAGPSRSLEVLLEDWQPRTGQGTSGSFRTKAHLL